MNNAYKNDRNDDKSKERHKATTIYVRLCWIC